MRKLGFTPSTYDEPPHTDFDLFDLVTNHDITKHNSLLDLPLTWIYATADRILRERMNQCRTN